MTPKTVSIALDSDDVKAIWDFFDVVNGIEHYAQDKRTIDIVNYLMEKWAYQQRTTGDSTIYVDQIVKKDDN